MSLMVLIILIIVCCVISGIVGYLYGVKLAKDAKKISEQTLVNTSSDSIVQAQIIGKIIRKRATILGNGSLSWKGVFDENKIYYALDGNTSNLGVHTMAFLDGNSTKLIKFIRICHACGCSVILRQIGAKEDALQYPEQEIFLSNPNLNISQG